EKSEALLLDFEETKNELKKLEYKRILHSVKGSAKAVGEDQFAKIVHDVEDSLSCVTIESMDFQLKFLDASSQYIRSKMIRDERATNDNLEMLKILLKAEKM
ncbi:MAG: hypothetical protein K2Q18_14250, partial [Bdellovibrionales bacterium]|nr:hypothetical protein [Bdellovibrionales bacterium]